MSLCSEAWKSPVSKLMPKIQWTWLNAWFLTCAIRIPNSAESVQGRGVDY